MTRTISHSAFMVGMLIVTLATVASADGLSEAEKSAGFVSIFDGKSLDGWQGATEHWAAEDGKLVYRSLKRTRSSKDLLGLKLMSTKEYADFVFRFEFKLGENANNGVAIRAPLDGDPAFVGMEIQVIDTLNWKGLKSWQVHGSIYGVVAAKTGHLKPAGEWNSEEILCQGRHVKVTLNGVVIVDADLDAVGDKTLDGTAHPGLKRDKGYIGLLGHTGKVEFRNLRIMRPHMLFAASVIGVAHAQAGEADASGVQDPPFAIICFPGPPASDNRVEHYEAIRRSNFNLVLPSYRYDDEQQLQMLDHCRSTGLRGVVNVKHLAPPLAEGPPPPNWQELIQSAAERFAKHPALYGYMVRDEPNAVVFPQLASVAREFERVDPAHDICINLFPIYASTEQLGTASYEQYLDEFLSTVKPSALCYDHYPFLRHGKDRDDYFQNLEVARRACLKYKTPLWIVVLSGWWEHFRPPTDAELRWQAYGALAYGIQGISYFTYWPVKDDYAAVVDYKGNPQPLYESIRSLNSELMVLGTRLATMRSVAVYHVGENLPTGCQRLSDDSWLCVRGNPPLAIGLFEGEQGSKFVLVVNRNCNSVESVTLRFPTLVGSVALVNPTSGRLETLNLQENEHRVTLPAGTGQLLRLQ